jgi:hypothetical protein
MKQFLLICLLACSFFLSTAQTYTTVQSGNFSSASTWSLGSIPPTITATTTAPCNCEIIVSNGHSLKISSTMTISNANFVLNGTNSELTFSNNQTLTITGTNSSINVKSGARIVKGNNNNTITLGGEPIYDGQTTKVNSTTGGTVNGPASASASRAGGPQFINSTLPVKLTEFKVTDNSGKAVLNWTTDQEINSEYYQIERSSDGKSFGTIGVTLAAGNSTAQLKYSYVDNTPLDGENYYRLKIVDIDAKFEYSPIKNINITAAVLALTAAPNPASNTLNITFSQSSRKDYQLKLINRVGQVVYSQRYSGTTGKISIPVTSFPEGTYFVEATDTGGARFTKSVLILRNR